MERAGRDVTREKFMAALEAFPDYDVAGFAVRYSPNNHAATQFVELTVVNRSNRFIHY